METQSQALTIKTSDLAKQLNESVFSVIGSDNMLGFEKAYQIANAAGRLKALLTPEYMAPIMELQGNRLGFKTDMDSKGGYKEDVVKNCLIEAVLTGVQPFGNQFNIIAGNCYITKEGFGYLLSNIRGLSYEIIPALPRINAEKTSAAIQMKCEWTMNGITKTRDLEIPVKMNNFMGTDAVIGKATRKARAWLFNTITGSEIGDGDASEYDGKPTIQVTPVDKEAERMVLMIKEAKTPEELKKLESKVGDEHLDLFNERMIELNEKK